MKHNIIFKTSLLFISFFVLTNINAQYTYVDANNIKFSADLYSTYASVIPNGYSGDIVIPASAEFAGNRYNVTKIGDQAFSDCINLTSISIPSTITQININAFYNCSGLTSFTSFNPAPPSTTTSCFDGINFSNCNLYVPVGSKSIYAASPEWRKFTSIIEFDPLSVENKATKSAKVYTEADNVVIKDVDLGENIKIYTVLGMQTKSIQAQNNIVKYKLPSNQIYIIQIGQTSRKVAL